MEPGAPEGGSIQGHCYGDLLHSIRKELRSVTCVRDGQDGLIIF